MTLEFFSFVKLLNDVKKKKLYDRGQPSDRQRVQQVYDRRLSSDDKSLGGFY